MNEKLSKLNEMARENEDLAKELMDLNNELVKKTIEETTVIADKYGIELEEEDFVKDNLLSLEDLDLASGGDDISDLNVRTRCRWNQLK